MPPHRYGQQHGVQRRAAADARRPWRRWWAGDTRPHLQQHLWPFVGKVPHQHLLQHRHNERGQQHARDEGRCRQAAGAWPPTGGDSFPWRTPAQGLLSFTGSTSHAPRNPQLALPVHHCKPVNASARNVNSRLTRSTSRAPRISSICRREPGHASQRCSTGGRGGVGSSLVWCGQLTRSHRDDVAWGGMHSWASRCSRSALPTHTDPW